uniref:non-specific protein-tyrosine kinase n=1 Tax=Monosiga ovata TaxID=81526 RepID=B3XVY9_9EUKA|nr:protein tyrosine kinase tec [Monosiga ovata]
MSTTLTALRQGMMMKRAQGKSALGPINWKARFFVLLPDELSYWDEFGGGTNPQAKKKGAIPTAKIHAVEEVPDTTFSRQFMFQVVHGDASSVLYIQSSDNTDRAEWIAVLRKLIVPAAHHSVYHPGCFESSRWSCCSESSKTTLGCKPTTPREPEVDSAAARATVRTQPSSTSLMSLSSSGSPPSSSPVPQSSATSRHTSVREGSQDGSPPAFTAIPTGNAPPLSLPPRSPAPPPAQKMLEVRVMYSHNATTPGDLSITEGDKLWVIDQSEPNWWKARDSQGRVGYIPSNYVRQAGIESEAWFHGRISRAEAAALLHVAKQEGCFLVRESESKVGEYSLSVSHGDSLRHYHIKKEGEEFYINDRHRFPDICKLIEYHKLNSGGLVTRLRKSIADLHTPAAAGLGHGKWELDPADFAIGRQLGSGQFGVVHEATYIGEKKVAVKMMKQGTMSEDDFISEALAMKNFTHPNLVQLYGVCTRTRPMWIITEIMTQGCLLDHLRNNQDLQHRPELLQYMGVQIAAAMMYLESLRFIHRDLAARNCLLGEKYIVKVGDFGLARFVLDDEYTASEGTKFPIKWAAPEVISYARFSTKSDVWSFGITLWELWSVGRTPYPTFTNAEVVDRVVDGYRLPRPPVASAAMHALMLDCWHKDPECRPTFADVVKLLDSNRSEYEDSIVEEA